jgi:hypothetical protein
MHSARFVLGAAGLTAKLTAIRLTLSPTCLAWSSHWPVRMGLAPGGRRDVPCADTRKCRRSRPVP